MKEEIEIQDVEKFLKNQLRSFNNIQLKQIANPDVKNIISYLFIDKLHLLRSYELSNEANEKLVLIAVEYAHHLHLPRARSINISIYWFGYFKSKSNFPHSFIRPETIEDFIHDLFYKVDLKTQNKSFDKKYFATSSKPDLFKLSNNLIDYLAKEDAIYIEFNRDKVFFRLNYEPVKEDQTYNYIQKGFELLKIINE